jgi:large subunit ribosomal protein MRP49
VGVLSQFVGPTARLQRDPDYRAVYRMWQQLRRRPLIQWDAPTLQIPIQDLHRLYERWCAARVALALLRLPGLRRESQQIVRQDDPADELSWRACLVEGGALLSLDGPAGERLTLRYQARYAPGGVGLRSLDRHTRVPDLALEIARPGARPEVIVLDAKYRLDASGGVPEDALADAYSYLGSIGTADGARAVTAVALLYPGRGPAEIYPSGAVALPLLPGDDGDLESWLAARLSRTSRAGGTHPHALS